MIEAMACGTPVLAFRCGAVPEIIDEGITGLIVETVEETIVAVPRLLELDRRIVRLRFEERFSSARMARDYVRRFRKLLQNINGGRAEAGVAEAPVPGSFEVETLN